MFHLIAPSSLVALDDRILLPAVGLVGLTETKRPEDEDVFAGPTFEMFRSFSSCFCFEESKDLSKLHKKKTVNTTKTRITKDVFSKQSNSGRTLFASHYL